MKIKTLGWAAGVVAASVIAAGYAGALVYDPTPIAAAQDPGPVHFTGVINDHPVSTTSSGAKVGPWEVSGPWSLQMKRESGTADFSAALTMELSDISLSAAQITADTRSQHTHQITMNGATVIENPPQGASPGDCPPAASGTPAYIPMLEMSGMADVAADGGSPFGAGVLVPLQVCIDGNSDIQFSNLTLVFTNNPDGTPSPATLHFGTQPIHGVVRTAKPSGHDWHD
ncbi:MAG: hypothetical protein ACRD1L_04575 [Terriglobales bacterium]